MKRIVLFSCLSLFTQTLFGQVSKVEELDTTYLNWYNLDYETNGLLGTSVEKAYAYLAKDSSQTKTVIVAIIDSGVDIEHEDLKGKIWINEDEIPDNGIDDDQNGYVDDIHGWNFIGNAAGEHVFYENLEYTRIVKENNADDPTLEEAKAYYEKELAKRKVEKENIDRFLTYYTTARSIIQKKTGVEVHSLEDLQEVKSNDQQVLVAKKFLTERYESGFSEQILESLVNRNNEMMDYYLNLDFSPRGLVGDDPKDINDRNYGNPDVAGPSPNHGTSVATVVAGIRNNGIGINGIASNVKIMSVRSTPNGDERDKDVALSIYYAVDNGADIINMSFGKDFSPQKQFVDDAVRYAEEKGVLLVHAAGNSGENIDVTERFPSDRYLDGSEPTNWINVGASSNLLNEEVAAIFSNYGQKYVDLFAPGVNIISADTTNTYSMNDGTSLAAPVVSGIAALVLSYYPDLEPEELIDILMSSTFQFKKPKKVLQPSVAGEKREKVIKLRA